MGNPLIKKENVGMYSINEELICVFRTLTEATNCLIAIGLAVNKNAARSGISSAVYKNKASTYKGFIWKYEKNN